MQSTPWMLSSTSRTHLPLSPFAKTLQDADEEFYKTFPDAKEAARIQQQEYNTAHQWPLHPEVTRTPYTEKLGYHTTNQVYTMDTISHPATMTSLDHPGSYLCPAPSSSSACHGQNPSPFFLPPFVPRNQGMWSPGGSYMQDSYGSIPYTSLSRVPVVPSQGIRDSVYSLEHLLPSTDMENAQPDTLTESLPAPGQAVPSQGVPPASCGRSLNIEPQLHDQRYEHPASSLIPRSPDSRMHQEQLPKAKSKSKSTSSTHPLPKRAPNATKQEKEKKVPHLACYFCRGRKIACGPSNPDSADRTCNQCQRRSLKCEHPVESRRGMRKKKASTT